MKALTLISLLAAAALTPAVAQKREGRGPKIAKPRIEDTIKANVYADNWFQLYINGELVATRLSLSHTTWCRSTSCPAIR